MAHTIDEVFDNQSAWFGWLYRNVHTGAFEPNGNHAIDIINDIKADSLAIRNSIGSGGSADAKLDSILTLLQHVSDGIDTLLDTLNGGHIDQQTDLIIEKIDDVLAATNLIGTLDDEWNDGTHTIMGALKTIGDTEGSEV